MTDEAQLIHRCHGGDGAARRELYDRTSGRIYGLLLRMTGSRDDAFDLSQSTYVRAFERIAQFDGRSSVSTWLYRIAVNEALQLIRHRATERVRLKELEEPRGARDTAPSQMARIDVQDALAELDADERAILLLRYQEGLDYRKIAEVLECAEGTVGSRLNRARARMREILAGGYGDREEEDVGAHPRDGL